MPGLLHRLGAGFWLVGRSGRCTPHGLGDAGGLVASQICKKARTSDDITI